VKTIRKAFLQDNCGIDRAIEETFTNDGAQFF